MRQIGLFALRFMLVFALLAWPWPLLREAVNAVFRGEAWLVTRFEASTNRVKIEKFSDPRYSEVDVLVTVSSRSNMGGAGERVPSIPFDSMSQGWIPLAMLIALYAATPLAGAKRWKALLFGAIMLELTILIGIAVSVNWSLAQQENSGTLLYLMFAHRLLVENIWMSFVTPLLLWAAWLAWSGHWRTLAGRLESDNVLAAGAYPRRQATSRLSHSTAKEG